MSSTQKESAPSETDEAPTEANNPSVSHACADATEVTIIACKDGVVGMTPDARVTKCSLAEALTREWPGDHHLTAYAPIEMPHVDGSVTTPVRARTSPRSGANAVDDPNRDLTIYNVEGAELRMVALIGDIDDVDAHAAKAPASDAWRAEIEPKLDATGLLWYRTKGGARVVGVLDTPYVITAPAHAAEWSDRYDAWCDDLATRYGVQLDRTCGDATRVFRLPNVVREGAIERSDLHGALAATPLPRAIPGARTKHKAPNATSMGRPEVVDDDITTAIWAVLGALGPADRWAHCKFRLCGAIGGMMRKTIMSGYTRADCAELVRFWLSTGPTGDIEHGVQWACNAWDKLPEFVSGRDALDAIVGEEIGSRIEQALLLPWKARKARGAQKPAQEQSAPTSAPAAERMPFLMEMTDTGNARRLVSLFGQQLRYCKARRKWYVWEGARWVEDETSKVETYAKEAAESLWEAANEEEEQFRGKARQWAAKSLDCNRIRSMISLAESEPGIAIAVGELDSHPWLINVSNGTLDLRTGQLSAPDPKLLMTKCCATSYDPDAQSDLWDTFLARTTGGDKEIAAYLQRALGYALVGAWHEKAFWFGFGPPDGGKSTMLGVVGDVLGSYHVSASAKTWMVQSAGGNRGDVTRLLGARLVTTLEIQRGMRFDEELVKKSTGGDKLTAAAKYEAEIEFAPTFALWMGANDRPIIRDDDEGMWSRMRCVPFTHVVPKEEQDPHLRITLRSAEHAPAILKWLIDGCLAWQREGLGECAAVARANGEYRQSMNLAAGFAEDRLHITGNWLDEVSATQMRAAYESWCRDNNVRTPLGGKALGRRLRELGIRGGDDATRHAVAGGHRFPEEKTPMDRHWRGVLLARDA